MSWEQMLSIVQEARDIDADERAKRPVVCPYDFTLLVESSDGTLHCPWAGDYEYPKDGIVR